MQRITGGYSYGSHFELASCARRVIWLYGANRKACAMSDAWEELATKYLRALAKRDMVVWRKRVNHENILFVDDKDRPEPIAKSETSYRRLMRAARTSPEWMERNT